MNSTRALPGILADIKLAHSVFALPFALVGLLLGTAGRLPSPALLLEVVAATVLARSAAMGCNRLADSRFDATNARTSRRALPSGRVSRRAMLLFVLLCAAGFVAVAGLLNRACLLLSPLVLAVLIAYSFSKRVTHLTHLLLGLSLALAPPAAWLAARGSLGPDAAPVPSGWAQAPSRARERDAALDMGGAVRWVAEEAIALDSNYAYAYSALALTHMSTGLLGLSRSFRGFL